MNGNALVGATVLVQNYSNSANAAIYSDNGLTPISTSTVVTGSDGQFSFFAADGDYNLVMSKNSTVFKTQSPVTLFDGAAQLTFADTGTANAYATSNSALEKALRAGLRASFQAANTNTGASTFAYNGLTAKNLVFPGGGAIVGGVIQANGIYAVEYDGTNWELRNGSITQAIFNSFLGQATYTGASSDSYSDAYILRNAGYSGGTAGHVATAMTVQTTVSGTGATNYEWALLALLFNSANAGQNVASYAQGNRQTTTTGPTWASVCEVIDNSGQANPTTGLVALEIDCRANGTDSQNNRVPLHIVASRPASGGAAVTVGCGILIDNNNDGTNTNYGNGIFLGNKGGGTCTFTVGINLAAATCTTGGIGLAQGMPILFDAAGSNQLSYNGSGLDYVQGGTLKTRLLSSGGLQVLSAQVVGQRINGYGTPTGGSHQASFAAGSITLANLAAAVAQLIIDLETHGLLGT